MGTFQITVEIADPRGQHFEAIEMLVDTGATFTKAPRDLLEELGILVESTYTAALSSGSRGENNRGRTAIRLQGEELTDLQIEIEDQKSERKHMLHLLATNQAVQGDIA